MTRPASDQSHLPTTPRLSLAMIVKNEEDALERCLESVRGAVDEIVVVDTGSTDRTPAVARAHGATVLSHPWAEDFAAARNAGLERCRGEWILFLDADEELVREDVPKLRAALDDQETDGYHLQLVNFIGEEAGLDAVLNPAFRLFRNHPVHRFAGAIHEQVLPSVTARGGRVRTLRVRVNHYGYLDSVARRKDKVSRNLTILLREVEKDPTGHFHRFNLGVEYMRLRDFRRALEQYRASFQHLPTLEVAYAPVLLRNIVFCLKELGRVAEAEDILRDAKEAYPDYTDLWFLEGLLYSEAKAFAKAAAAFRAALERGESDERHITQAGVGTYKAAYGLGRALLALGEERAAVEAFVHALELEPRMYGPLYDLARLLVPREEPDRLDAFFQGLILPADAEGQEQLSQAYAGARAYDLAIRALDRAMVIAPGSARRSFRRGFLALKTKAFDRAADIFSKLVEHPEYGPPAQLFRGLAAMMQGRLDRAAADFTRAADHAASAAAAVAYHRVLAGLTGTPAPRVAFCRPDDAREAAGALWELMDQCLEWQAFEAFEVALGLWQSAAGSREAGTTRLALGKLYYHHGYWDSAVEELVEAARAGAVDAEAFAMLGDVCRRREQWEDAEAFYAEALRREPERLGHYTALVSVLARQKKYEAAEEVLELGVRHHPYSEILEATRLGLEAARAI